MTVTHTDFEAGGPPIANVDMAAAWDGPEGDHWTEHADRYEGTGERFGAALLDAVSVGAEATILDVGCGTGKLTLDLARMSPLRSVLGIDLSSKMLELARSRAAHEGLANVEFERGDVQVHPFPTAAFDQVVSSFGSMFFADPVAAFANLARATRPAGELAMLVWRDLEHNEWLTVLRGALALGRGLPRPPAGAPGPFAFAEPEHTQRVLTEAGLRDFSCDEVTEPLRLGADVDDAFAFVSTFGITKGLTQDLDDRDKAAALDRLKSRLTDHETNDGVLFGASAWLIRAKVPATS